MNKQCILRADTKNMGTAYYVNRYNLAFKKQDAKVFPCIEEAEDHMGSFKRIFTGETPKFSIEEVKEEDMKDITIVNKIVDYGVKRVLVKQGNKILGWTEPYSSYNANTHEIGKWFFCIGKPSQKDPIQYVCEDEGEALSSLLTAVGREDCIEHKHQEDILEDESLANVPFDDRGDYYG